MHQGWLRGLCVRNWMDSRAGRKRKGDPDVEHSDLGRSPAKQKKAGSSYSSISQRIMVSCMRAKQGYQDPAALIAVRYVFIY